MSQGPSTGTWFMGGLDHPVMKVSMTIRGGRHFFTGKDPYQGRVSRHGLFVFPGVVNGQPCIGGVYIQARKVFTLVSHLASRESDEQ